MRNPYTRPGGMFGRRSAGGFTRASASAPAGPTVILDANYLTDALLNGGGSAIGNGDLVGSWPTATGGTFTDTLALAAGATDRCTYVTASGVHTAGLAAALTLPTPVTIPAGEFRMYYRFKYSGSGILYFLSSPQSLSAAGGAQIYIYSGATRLQCAAGTSTEVAGSFTAGDYTLFCCRDASDVLYYAWSGSATLQAGGSMVGSFEFANMLAQSSDESSGGILDYFSSSGNFIQKIKIESGISSRDLVWEAANGGTL